MMMTPHAMRGTPYAIRAVCALILLGACAFGRNIYFANLHAHTEYSDGQGLPAQAYTYARDTARIDILGLTDHTSYLNRGTFAQQREIAAQFTEPGRFIALAGQEFGSLAQFGHFSIYDADSLSPTSTSDLPGFYQWHVRLKEPAQFNHPRIGDYNDFAYNRKADAYATTIEVVNGSGLYTEVNESMYTVALNQGWHCAPVANQDNHRKKWGDATTTRGQIPLTGIWADTLTKEAVLSALFARQVYAVEVKPKTDRIYLRRFAIDVVEMGMLGTIQSPFAELVCEVEAGTQFRQIYLYRDGAVYDSATTSSLDTNSVSWHCTVPVGNSYYYLKGEQKDGDRFWSAPIWLSYRPVSSRLEFHPNPLRSGAVRIDVARDTFPLASAELSVFDASGRQVYEDRTTTSPSPLFVWEGRTNGGKTLVNGIYLVRVALNYANQKPALFLGKLAVER